MVIRTRDNLIEFLENNTSGRYLRALQNCNENLGGFSQILGCNAPGWIVQATSKHGDTYYIAIYCYGHSCYLLAILFNGPSWKYWIGDQSKNPLYQGDNPEKYKELRNAKTKNNRLNTAP